MGLVEVRVVVQAALRSGREVSYTFALAVGRGKRLSQSQVRLVELFPSETVSRAKTDDFQTTFDPWIERGERRGKGSFPLWGSLLLIVLQCKTRRLL